MRNFSAVFSKSFKQLWKDKIGVGMLIIFPIAIIFVLGSALGGLVEGNQDLDGERFQLAAIVDENSPFAQFLHSEEISSFIETTAVDNEEQALNLLEEREVHLIAMEYNGEISVILPQATGPNQLPPLALIDSYNQVGAAMTIAMAQGSNLEELTTILNANIEISRSPLGNRTPGSMDFFAVTMLVMIMLFAGLNGAELFNKSMLTETGRRMLIAPISKSALMSGLVAAATAVSFLQGLIVVLFTRFVYNVHWGDNWAIVLLTLFALVLFSNALAILLLIIFKKMPAVNAVLQTLIFIMTFLAGGFGPSLAFGENIARILRFVPNNLAQTILFTNAFGGNEQTMLVNLTVLLGTGLTLLVAAFITGRKRLA